MSFLRLARVHARRARRQSALWVVSILLTLIALGIALIAAPDLASPRGTQVDLAFLGQMLGLVPAIAYAAACTDLASAPARLGIMEVEDSTPVSPAKLLAARVAGMLSVVLWPSAAVLIVCGIMQAGGFASVAVALSVFLVIVVPLAFLATALSAFIGALLPQALARIIAVAVWCAVVCFTTFAPMPVGKSKSKMGVVTDAICQGFYGCQPVIDLDVMGGTVYTPLDAVFLFGLRIALALVLIAAAAFVSRKRNFRRG
ncbi:hypothetical protein [Raoultibacter phocaeensis]|uniref:hypothetical protein n=1 Tax=Raoultibacter phocaeensis TaxID=2479841 RepID=UPI001117CCE3|nr:hypothetical protein [Raoultibacter phocaeensis]